MSAKDRTIRILMKHKSTLLIATILLALCVWLKEIRYQTVENKNINETQRPARLLGNSGLR